MCLGSENRRYKWSKSINGTKHMCVGESLIIVYWVVTTSDTEITTVVVVLINVLILVLLSSGKFSAWRGSGSDCAYVGKTSALLRE